MLTRIVEKDINKWIEKDNRALLIYGVRQAGKTYIIRHCLKKNNCDYVEFNLIEQPEIVTILESSSNQKDLLLKLSLFSSQKLTPGQTIIFLDEIQKCKDIVTKIKFLTDAGTYRFILSGSLLGIEITNLRSAPAGYLKMLQMYPMNFEEFLQIFAIPDGIIQHLKTSYLNETEIDPVVHKKMMDIFNLYIIIGGMPAAVEKYRLSENINDIIDEHLSLIEQYKLDFTQYEAENRKLILSNIYDLIPAELNEKNKRFKIADINKNLRYERISDSFTWLWKSGVAIPVFNVTEPRIPLKINQKSTLFKLFLSDTGLLTSLYGKAAKLKIMNQDSDINKGAIFENVVAQELHSYGIDVYYYNNKKIGEIDFLIENCGQVLPIEVKSGKAYERHLALNQILSDETLQISKSIVFCNSNIHKNSTIIYMPIYMIMFLKPDDIKFSDIHIDRFKF